MGTQKAVENVNTIIAPKILGRDSRTKQHEIDNLMQMLDGTPNKARLGANAMLSVSMAIARAGAAANDLGLYRYLGKTFGTEPRLMPVPMCNIINGGKHAGQENSIQEHMILPVGAKSFGEGLRMVSEVFQTLKANLKKRFGPSGTLVGDEGGFAVQQINRSGRTT